MIDSETKLYGLLGSPVSGSRSPWIHNHVFEACGIPGAYLAFDVPDQRLEEAVLGLRALGAGGLNVTIPYKSAIIPFLDSVDPAARALGAVNTIVCDGGHWRGFNTDGPGLLAVLRRHITNLESCRILVLGAGGAAKGICGSLIRGGIKDLGIWNRSAEKAVQLTLALHALASDNQRILHVDAEDRIGDYNLVINATSVGMEPHTEVAPVPIDCLKPGACVCDIVYKPHKTRLLRDAEASGHPVVFGIEMLIEQALLSQQLWNPIDEGAIAAFRTVLIEKFEALHK